MNKTGVLDVDNSRVSRLQGWRKLAREGEDAPLQAATDFLLDGKMLDDGDTITVTGTLGALDDGTAVCFITDAMEVVALTSAKSASAAKKAAKKATKGGRRSGAKRTTKKAAKKTAKKGGARKGAARRTSKRRGDK
jgi:hypothetical protein